MYRLTLTIALAALTAIANGNDGVAGLIGIKEPAEVWFANQGFDLTKTDLLTIGEKPETQEFVYITNDYVVVRGKCSAQHTVASTFADGWWFMVGDRSRIQIRTSTKMRYAAIIFLADSKRIAETTKLAFGLQAGSFDDDKAHFVKIKKLHQ